MRVKKEYAKQTFKKRSDWLANRGLGGSSASAILNMNPWKSKLELYQDFITTKTPSEFEDSTDSAPMQLGRALEPLIRKEFAQDFKGIYKVHTPKNNEMFRSTKRSWMTATLDGILTEIETKRKGILEIKTHDIRNKEDAEKWENNSIPNNYFIQVLHYFLVMNDFEFAVVAARLRYFKFDDEGERKIDKIVTKIYFVERSEVKEQLDYLLTKENEFVDDVNKRKIPPIILNL